MFQNSTEATEAAIKVARRYFYSIENQKIEFYVLKIVFMEELGSNFCKRIKENDRGIWSKSTVSIITFGDHNSLKRKQMKIQLLLWLKLLRSGIKVIPIGLKELRKLQKKKILLILDEVHVE